MSMWHDFTRTGAYGEDPARPTEFIYRVPEYDDEGNLISGQENYWQHDFTPSASGHANRQPGSFGLGTSFKDSDIGNETGPAEVLRHEPNFTTPPGSWGPANAGEFVPAGEHGPEGYMTGAESGYPYPPAEQLRKDTHWALGPGKEFEWPGGREAAEKGHNLTSSHGFTLENSGPDDEPVPSYVHQHTGSRIEPSGDEDAPWQLTSELTDPESREPYGTSLHSSTYAAAMAHKGQLDDIAAKEREYRPYTPSYDYAPSRSRSTDIWGRERRPSGSPGRGFGKRPTNVDDAMRHAVGTASYMGADEAQNSGWDLLNKGTTYGGHPSRLLAHPSQPSSHTLSTGQLDDYVAQQFHQDVASGKTQHVIYHHATPLAWLNVEPSAEHGAGEKHTWVVPDERYSNTSSRRQRAIRSAIRSTGHGDEVQEPYNPDRGFPRAHHRGDHPEADPPYLSRGFHARDTVARLRDEGYERPSYNTRQGAVFIRPTTQEHEDHYPGTSYGWRSTRTHGVYLRPVEKPMTADSRGRTGAAAWVVGEHDNGTNKVQGSKRFDNLEDALAHGERMHQWIAGGSQGEPPATADRSLSAYQRDLRRRRGPGSAIPRTPTPTLPGQEELPLHESSTISDWSSLLRG